MNPESSITRPSSLAIQFYESLTEAVIGAESLTDLIQPLLATMEELTGLESTYLTEIDLQAGIQKVLFSRNRGTLSIDAGLSVPWEDTLCKRALEEGLPYTCDVQSHWQDSAPARVLGIQTYLNAPIRLVDGRLFGTLCAASSQVRELPSGTTKLLEFLAVIIAQFIDRERLIRRLSQENAVLDAVAHTDPLTQLPNRKALLHVLEARQKKAQEESSAVVVFFIDMDRFKEINDSYGHKTGDEFLRIQGERLRDALRPTDFLARIGGDEFVALASFPSENGYQVRRVCDRLREATTGRITVFDRELDYCGASIGFASSGGKEFDAEKLLVAADADMYSDKAARKNTGNRRPS